MTYAPQYPGGWRDLPDTSTPIIAAALNKIDAALGADDASIAANAANIASALATIATHTSQIGTLQTTVAAMMAKVAATALAGYTYINGTSNILVWTAPNDGVMHRMLLIGQIRTITAQTGGQIQLTFTYPDGSATPNATINAGGSGVGFHGFTNQTFLVAPGTTVTLAQSTAQTAGSGTLWAEMWAS